MADYTKKHSNNHSHEGIGAQFQNDLNSHASFNPREIARDLHRTSITVDNVQSKKVKTAAAENMGMSKILENGFNEVNRGRLIAGRVHEDDAKARMTTTQRWRLGLDGEPWNNVGKVQKQLDQDNVRGDNGARHHHEVASSNAATEGSAQANRRL